MAVVRRAAAGLLTLASTACGSVYNDTESPCDPGPFFEGPIIQRPRIGATGDRFLVTYRQYEDGVADALVDGVVVDLRGAPDPATRFRIDGALDVWAVLSGPDRALVVGEDAARQNFAEIRTADGARAGDRIPLASIGLHGAFDGDSFLVAAPVGARRIGLDGTELGTIDLPDATFVFAPTAGVTWALHHPVDGDVTATRIARGGDAIDIVPALVQPEVFITTAAARPTEAAVVTYLSDHTTWWTTLAADGTITGPVPLSLDVSEFDRPRLLVPDRDDYLYIIETVGYDLLAVRVTPAGVASPSFLFADYAANNGEYDWARAGDTSLVVKSQSSIQGRPPEIQGFRVEPAAAAPAPTLIATTEGDTYTVDCGCSAARGDASLVLVLGLAVAFARLRAPRSRRARRHYPGG